jgi:hypothetical protein
MRGGKAGTELLRDLDPFVIGEAPDAAQEQRAYPRCLQIPWAERGVRRFHRARCACIEIWPDTPGWSDNRSYPETGFEEIGTDYVNQHCASSKRTSGPEQLWGCPSLRPNLQSPRGSMGKR